MVLVVQAETKEKDSKYGAEYHREYASKNRSRIRKNRRDWQRRVREEALKHYGGKCACCKESLSEFLGIHPRRGTAMPDTRTPLIYWLWTNEFPEGFQVLCRNCGGALEKLGYCPHRHSAI